MEKAHIWYTQFTPERLEKMFPDVHPSYLRALAYAIDGELRASFDEGWRRANAWGVSSSPTSLALVAPVRPAAADDR
jgi:hypothetical protein